MPLAGLVARTASVWLQRGPCRIRRVSGVPGRVHIDIRGVHLPGHGELARAVEGHGVLVRTGVFRAHMLVSLVNDGPVTLLLEV